MATSLFALTRACVCVRWRARARVSARAFSLLLLWGTYLATSLFALARAVLHFAMKSTKIDPQKHAETGSLTRRSTFFSCMFYNLDLQHENAETGVSPRRNTIFSSPGTTQKHEKTDPKSSQNHQNGLKSSPGSSQIAFFGIPKGEHDSDDDF